MHNVSEDITDLSDGPTFLNNGLSQLGIMEDKTLFVGKLSGMLHMLLVVMHGVTGEGNTTQFPHLQ